MTKRIIFISLPFTAVVLASCQKATAPQGQSVPEAAGEAMEMGKAIESGKPTVCTMTNTDGSAVTYQLMGGKMRADGMQLGEAEGTGSMINDLAYIYSWKTGETQGMKIPIPKETITPSANQKPEVNTPEVPDFTNEQEVENYKEQGYKIDCQAQAVDDSVFVPPAEVNFVDPTAMMQGVKDKLPTGLDQVGQQGMTPEMQERIRQLQEQGEVAE